jgi:hypothetical protein
VLGFVFLILLAVLVLFVIGLFAVSVPSITRYRRLRRM